MEKIFHDAFGVYGVIFEKNRLLLIKKKGGPYTNRYDLPGGSLETGESLSATLQREIKEETGIIATKWQQLGTSSIILPWHYQNATMNRHICVFYQVSEYIGDVQQEVTDFMGQDSLGAAWVPLSLITNENASPIVWLAKEYCLKKKNPFSEIYLDKWQVQEKPQF
ncbi:MULTISPECIES: NUDIX hydrolase [Enterococcus]|uniref:NUDIX hydrolase n=1 Tax=Enterococcus TaxID=1350 RepID=UPI0010F73D4B|nr:MULTISPECIES: NUDIX hydrolase [Enterococcus]KAF1301164.1 hypothetical protein BAU16_10520 [Enterococcus sp. JM9B]